jgi:putative transferase (TIGR04331 family)
LASNTPTLCFWNGGLEHLLPSAKSYYELLRGAGILADSPEHASLLVSNYWDNIDEWWESEQVQNARILFCEEYARVEKTPVRTLKRLLLNHSGNYN